MKRVRKRALCGLSALFIFTSTLVGSAYESLTVHAIALPVTYTAYEALFGVLMSLGITVSVADGVSEEDAVEEFKDTFDQWLDDWTYSNFGTSDREQIKNDFATAISDCGDGIVKIGQDTWTALKEWKNDIIQKTEPVAKYNVNSLSNSIPYESMSVSEKTYFDECISDAKSKGLIGYVIIYSNNYSTSNDDRKICYRIIFSVSDDILSDGQKIKFGDNINYCYGVDVYSNSRGKNVTCEHFLHKYNNGWIDLTGMWKLIRTNLILPSGITYDIPFPVNDLGYDELWFPDNTAVRDYAGYDIITPGRTWDGTSVTGDVTISIPDAGTVEGVQDGTVPIDAAMDVIGVVPVDTVDGVTIPVDDTDAIPIEDVKIPDEDTDDDETDDGTPIGDINLLYDLTGIFPFCIPFDLYYSIQGLYVSPKAPVFELPIKIGKLVDYTVRVDMSEWYSVIKIFKSGLVLLWIITLIMITRKLIKW